MTAKQFAAMMARNGGRRRPAGSGPVRVRTHQRTRQESARYIVAATVAETRGIRTRPVERALEILFNEGRIAKRGELYFGRGG